MPALAELSFHQFDLQQPCIEYIVKVFTWQACCNTVSHLPAFEVA